MKQALIDATLELLRVMTLAVIPVLISSLEAGQFDWRTLAVVGSVAGLRFVDKLLHRIGEEQGRDKLVRGLTRF